MPGSEELLQHQIGMGGAILTPEAPAFSGGNDCPPVAHFGDAASEYASAHTGALFDVSDRVQIELRGKDARGYLHNFCTNDINRLTAGQGCEALLTTTKGRILAHVFVFVTDDSVWIDSPSIDEQLLLDHLDRYLFSEDVELLARTQTFGELYIAGESCSAVLSELGLTVDSLDPMQHSLGTIAQLTVAVRRFDIWDAPGFFISVERDRLVDLWRQLAEAGMQPSGGQAFHARRIGARFPLHGVDISDQNLAQEAMRTEQAISFTKGCYLGQEPIARIDSLGHINRQLTCLQLDSDILPPAGTAVLAADGAEVGHITSAVIVPDGQQVLALSMLRSSHAVAGTSLTIPTEHHKVAATVAD